MDTQSQTVPFRKVPFRKIPFRKIPFRKIPFRKIPFRKIPFRKVPFRNIPFRKIPFRFVSFRFAKYRKPVTRTRRATTYTNGLINDEAKLTIAENPRVEYACRKRTKQLDLVCTYQQRYRYMKSPSCTSRYLYIQQDSCICIKIRICT